MLVVLPMIAGCAQLTEWFQGQDVVRSNDPIILGAPEAETYLKELYDLAVGDPPAQAEIFADAEAAALLTPGPNSQLRLALVRATPGHSEYNPEKAQSLLRDLLSQSELLSSAEIALATIHLSTVERAIVANAEARRLRDAGSQAAGREERAISQRLDIVEAENRRLRRELEAAESKLKAITSIERSIREQE
jgi:hypothetical protein